jgi:hypothetical protein
MYEKHGLLYGLKFSITAKFHPPEISLPGGQTEPAVGSW